MTSSSVLYLQIAQREGYFKAEGLSVEIINMRGEIAAKIASAGEIDFFTQALSGLTAAMRGLPLKILMIVDQRPAWDFLAQPNIKSFAQLKGGIVGILSFEGSVAQATREMLRKNHLDPAKDVQLMVMGGNDMRFVSLKSKAIQATLLDSANSYRAHKDGFNVLGSAADYVTYYLNGGLVASQDQITKSSERILRFLGAAYKGYLFFLNRREPSIRYMMAILKTNDRDAVSAIYDSSIKAISRDGMAEEKQLLSMIDETKRSTAVKRDFQVDDLVDFSFLRKAKEKMILGDGKP
ncbi:MAG: ABC transporter substrate-binding protein [Candidatus Binatia bacterium]